METATIMTLEGNEAVAYVACRINLAYTRLMAMAQQVVWQKWDVYEDMAARRGSHFHPDGGMV